MMLSKQSEKSWFRNENATDKCKELQLSFNWVYIDFTKIFDPMTHKFMAKALEKQRIQTCYIWIVNIIREMWRNLKTNYHGRKKKGVIILQIQRCKIRRSRSPPQLEKLNLKFAHDVINTSY